MQSEEVSFQSIGVAFRVLGHPVPSDRPWVLLVEGVNERERKRHGVGNAEKQRMHSTKQTRMIDTSFNTRYRNKELLDAESIPLIKLTAVANCA